MPHKERLASVFGLLRFDKTVSSVESRGWSRCGKIMVEKIKM
jgi:hypothetical protein